MSDRVLIIVPTYNEADNLEPLLTAIHQQLPQAHLLVVDDNSPDGTGQLAERIASNDTRVEVMHRSGKLGLASAYRAGFGWGLERGYDYLFEMDADFSHDPAYLRPLLEAAKGGADLVLGSRYVDGGGTKNWGLSRRLISRGGNIYARAVLGLGVRDMTSGYRCFRRHVLEAIELDRVHSEGYSFQIEMTYRAVGKGFDVVEVPITFVDRRVGQSKMTRRIVAEAMWMVWRLRLQG